MSDTLTAERRTLADISTSAEIAIHTVAKAPDPYTREHMDWENHRLSQRERVNDLIERKKYAAWIFSLSVVWLFAVLGVVVAAGLGKLVISDKVLVTLITTSTANVIAILAFVVRYLFPPRSV